MAILTNKNKKKKKNNDMEHFSIDQKWQWKPKENEWSKAKG